MLEVGLLTVEHSPFLGPPCIMLGMLKVLK